MQFKLVIPIIISLLFVEVAYGQSTCATATQINNLPYTTPGLLGSETTCGAGNNYTKADRCGNRFLGGEEFMYAYTPTVDECVNLTVTPSGLTNDTPTALFVTEDCPDDPNGKCMAQYINTTNDALPKPSIITNLQLKGGKTYYFQVTAQTECFEFSFDATVGNGCAPDPTGYDCDDADEIQNLPYNYNGTTCNKTSIINVGNECYSTFYSGTAYIFKYTPDDTECIEITGRSVDQTVRFSMHDECPTLTDTTCVKSRYFYTFGDRTYYETLDSGKTYYFVANSTSTAPACSAYSFDIREISDEGTTCDLAYTLNAPTTTFNNHTTQCKGDFYNEDENCSTSAFYFGGNEVLYKYESNGDECVVASAINMTSYGNIQLFQGCPKADTSNLMARDDRCGFRDPKTVTIEYTFSEPGTYYFLVSGRHYKSSWSDTYYDFNYDFQFSTSTLDDLGKDCANADTLAGTLPSRKDGLSVQCKGDDYHEEDACNALIEGADYVLVYTAPENFCGSVMARNTSGKGGITLMTDCPGSSGSQCLGSVICPTSNCDSIYLDYTFQQGETYYIIASGNGGNFFSFDIEVQKAFNTIDGCATCAGDACVECENSNFEKSTLVNWTGRNGTYANPGLNAGFNAGYINDLESGHTIVNGGLDDPMVGPLVKTSGPLGGRYSLRLGNYISGGKGEQISFDINVTPDTKNFFYYYAVVFEDPPGHDETDQPFFGVEMVDGDGLAIACADYQVRSNNAEGFNEVGTIPNERNIATVKYKDWSLVAVPLDNYMGQTVTITFTATDCGLSGHMGYAYVDAFCGDLKIVPSGGASALCPGESVTLKAPDGFADYLWNTGETTQEITVNAAGNYTVILTPYSENPILDCAVTLEYEVESSPVPTVNFLVDDGCNDAFIAFASTANGGEPGLGIRSYAWDFGDGTTSADSAMLHEFPGPGNYTIKLTVVNDNGCVNTFSKDVTIDPYTSLAPLNAQDTLQTCILGQVEFTSDALNDVSYSWTGPNGVSENTNNFFLNTTDINESGWYNLKVVSTLDPCVVSYDSTYLYIEVVPQLSIIQDTTICFSDSIFEVYANGGTTYQWLPSASYQNPNDAQTLVTMPYSDSIKVVLGFNLCPDSTIGSFITVNRPTEYLAAQSDTSICLGESFELQNVAEPNDFLMWISPNQDSSFVNPHIVDVSTKADSGTYTLIAYLDDNYYCPFDSLLVDVEVFSLPELMTNINPETACPGESVTVEVLGANSYLWYNAESDLISNASVFDSVFTDPQWLYVEGVDGNTCQNFDSVEVKIYPKFKVDLGPDLKRCKGESAQLTVNASDFYTDNFSVLWNTGESTEQITAQNEGDYWVDVTINGCTNRDSVKLSIQDPSAFNLGNDSLLCEGDTLYLDLSGYSGAIIWNDGKTDAFRGIAYPGGTFSVEITSGECVLKDDISVDFQNQHAISLPPDETVCEGNQLNYSSPATSGTNTWDVNGNLIYSDDITLINPNNYTIILQNQQAVCTAQDTMYSVIENKPQGALPDTLKVCENQSVLADATLPNASSYSWDHGGISAQENISGEGYHYVDIVVSSCTIKDSVYVKTTVLPVPDLGPDIRECSTASVNLTNNTSGTPYVEWFYNGNTVGAGLASIPANQTGEYVLKIGIGSCINSDTVDVLIDANPIVDLGNDTALCPQQILNVATGYPTYQNVWNDNTTNEFQVILTDGKYYVDVTNGKCTTSDTILVSYIVTQVPNLGPDTSLCIGQTLMLSTNTTNSDSIRWNTQDLSMSISVSGSGTYYSDVYFGQCKVTDTVDVNFLSIPSFDLGPDIQVCEKTKVAIGNSNPFNHTWSNGSSADSLYPSVSGNYELTLANQHCTYTDDVDVNFVAAPVVDLGPDLLRCTGNSDVLMGPNGAYSYFWNTTQESRTKTINSTDTYILVVTDGICTRSDTMFAEYTIPEDPNLPVSTTICSDDSLMVDASVSSGSYLWSTGEANPVIEIKLEGNYFVDIQQGGCLNRYPTELRVTQKPILDLGPDIVLCVGKEVQVGTNLPGLSTSWSTGETTESVTLGLNGLYSVVVTDGPCVVSDEVMVSNNPLPDLPDGRYKICPDDSLTLDFSPYGDVGAWSDAELGLVRVMYPNDAFLLTVTNEFGCVSEVFINVALDYNCPDPVYVPNAFTPDGDGINDVFLPVMDETKMMSLTIYNRWGETMFHSEDSEIGWDGIYKAELAKSDMYAWVLKYISKYGKAKTIEGKILLLR